MLFVVLSIYITLFIRSNFNVSSALYTSDWYYTPIVILAIRFLFFEIFQIHHLVIRYTNTRDVAKIFLSCVLGTMFVGITDFVGYAINQKFLVPTSVWMMEFFITTVILVAYRFAFKMYYLESVNPSKLRKNIVIFGAGSSGVTTKRTIDRDNASKYNVLAFFDEDDKKINMQLESLPVIDYKHLDEYLSINNISFLIIAVQKISNAKIKEITDIALPYTSKY